MEIYERIKKLRKNELHLSQTEFGEKLGVSRSVIKNIELNALAHPEQKEPLYKLICKEFHVNCNWLISGTGEPFSEDLTEDEYVRATAEIDIKDSKSKRVIIDYWHLNAEDKELFWRFIVPPIRKMHVQSPSLIYSVGVLWKSMLSECSFFLFYSYTY